MKNSPIGKVFVIDRVVDIFLFAEKVFIYVYYGMYIIYYTYCKLPNVSMYDVCSKLFPLNDDPINGSKSSETL